MTKPLLDVKGLQVVAGTRTLIDALELDWLAATIDRLGAGNHWQHRARSALLDAAP